MKRREGVRQSFLNSARFFLALFSILAPGRLVALDLNLVRVGGYDTSGLAWAVAVSGNDAYAVDDFAGVQAIDVSNPADPRRVGGIGCLLDLMLLWLATTRSSRASTMA